MIIFATLQNMKKLLITVFLACTGAAMAQVGLNTTVLVNAKADIGGTITLTWPKFNSAGSIQIYKNSSSTPMNFTSVTATLDTSKTQWTDANAQPGNAYEDAVVKLNTSNAATAVGYIMAGNKTKEITAQGGVILVVDSNYIKPLVNEIKTLVQDLNGSGMPVTLIYAGRKEKVTTVKDRIRAAHDNTKPTPSYLYLLGHIPVPYSGNYTGNVDRCAFPPDGHVEGSGNHTGAWPADMYYAEFDGFYTDNVVNTTTGSLARNHNIPGDGKFDECRNINAMVLKMGRVDLFDMPIFQKSDTVLVKNYLNRAHDWRLNLISYVDRGLIDDNFGGIDLSATGWNTIVSCIPRDSVFGNRDYFTAQNKGNYLWSYGCGAGSYTSCSGIGAVNNFNPGIYNNIFTALAGSFFGDWDITNNFLRAPLASGSLVSFWGGIPKWYNHYFGLGGTIGTCTQISQNSTEQSFNDAQNKLHIALMGDPTLTLRTVPATGKLSAISQTGSVKLNWVKAKGKFDGYNIYRVDTVTNTWTKLNTTIIVDSFYTDSKNYVNGKHKYAVRAVRLETTGSGTYYNLGTSNFAWVNHTNAIYEMPKIQVQLAPNPAENSFEIQLNALSAAAAEIKILDISGKQVAFTSAIMSYNALRCDVSKVPNGIYFVQITCKEGQVTEKLIIQN